MKRKLILPVLISLFSLGVLTACGTMTSDEAKTTISSYNEVLAPYIEKADAYNKAVNKISDGNAKLNEALEIAQADLDKNETPFDKSTTTKLKENIIKAQKAIVPEVPEIVPTFEKISISSDMNDDSLVSAAEQAKKNTDTINNADIPENPDVPDYDKLLKSLKNATQDYEDSVQGLKQITKPSDKFVSKRLQRVKSITGIQAVTEDHDPNENLNKQGGYIGCVYFASSLVDQSKLYLNGGEDIVDVGTDGGGAVEVYRTVEEAENRNAYLSGFDGGMLSSGSHYVYGTLVIRTSDELTASQQKDLTKEVLDALLYVEHN